MAIVSGTGVRNPMRIQSKSRRLCVAAALLWSMPVAAAQADERIYVEMIAKAVAATTAAETYCPGVQINQDALFGFITKLGYSGKSQEIEPFIMDEGRRIMKQIEADGKERWCSNAKIVFASKLIIDPPK
jgi:hypothetical protein